MLQRIDQAFSYFVTESKAGRYALLCLMLAGVVLEYALGVA